MAELVFKNLKKQYGTNTVVQDFNLTIPNSEAVPIDQAKATRKAVEAASRHKYASPRTEIESALLANLGVASSVVELKPTLVPNLAQTKSAEVPKSVERVVPNTPPQAEVETKDRQHTNIKNNIGSEAEILDFTVTYEELFPEVHGRAR